MDALTGLLGKGGGPLTGKRVRLVSFGLPDLTRNAPCTVESHYSSGVVAISLPSGTVWNVPVAEVCVLSGKEKLPLPDKLGPLTKLTKAARQAAREEASGGTVLSLQ
eukprot:205496-Lingulodinium_polyedra.AAC.1